MVLSTTKRTSSVQSIINVNQGGGNKKAGLPYQVGRPYGFPIAMRVSQTRNTLFKLGDVQGLRFTVNPNVSISRPIGSTLNNVPYWKLP